MIDAIVSRLPAEEEMPLREMLEGQSWDEVTSAFRKWKSGIKVEYTKGTPVDSEASKEKKCDDKTAGIEASIQALAELKEKTVSKNYKDAFNKAIKVLNALLWE